MKIAIIGGGIAATVASKMLSGHQITVLDQGIERSNLSSHHAVMRLKSPELVSVLGCYASPIRVHKAALVGGRLIYHEDLQANNLYSKKVYEELRLCSISRLGTVDRYLIRQQVSPPGCKYNRKVIDCSNQSLTVETPEGKEVIEYDWCISTAPIYQNWMLAFKEDVSSHFQSAPIGIAKYMLLLPNTLHHTLYVPEQQYLIYRITMQEREIIVEYLLNGNYDSEAVIQEELSQLLPWLGLEAKDIALQGCHHTQSCGKMRSAAEDQRKKLIWRLTDEHKILSLGRYAIWKPIRADDLLEDVRKIQQIIQSHNHYDLAKERM